MQASAPSCDDQKYLLALLNVSCGVTLAPGGNHSPSPTPDSLQSGHQALKMECPLQCRVPVSIPMLHKSRPLQNQSLQAWSPENARKSQTLPGPSVNGTGLPLPHVFSLGAYKVSAQEEWEIEKRRDLDGRPLICLLPAKTKDPRPHREKTV